MYHIFFTCSSIEGYLGCFQVLPVPNNADMNTVERMSFGMRVHSLGMCPEWLVFLGLEVD